jgi:hypothetical protein
LRTGFRNIIFCIIILFFYLFLSGYLFAQEPDQEDTLPPAESSIPEPEEKATLIYQTDIAGADLDFFLKGSWNANVFFSSGVRFGPGSEVIFPWGLPNMPEGLVFEQVPDLTFSIWLLDRYFLEVTMVKEFEENTFLLGYQGKEGEILQSVRIGNRDVFISNYDFLNIPEQGHASLGVSAVITPGFSRHELLIRYDNTIKEKKVFVGFNEVVEEFVSPNSYLSGRSFMLPDAGITGLEVYIEDEHGEHSGNDGKRYRLASVNDIEQDTEQGLLFILNKVPGRILVYYTKMGFPVGDNALGAGALPGTSGGDTYPNFTGYLNPNAAGVKFDWTVTYLGETMSGRQVIVSGKTCLRIWEPGIFSPFEFLNCYNLPVVAPNDLWRVKIKAIPKGDESGNYKNFTYQPVFEARPGNLVFRVFINKINIRSNFWNHYPFPDTTHQLYGPLHDHNPPFFDWEIYTQVITPVTNFFLSQDVVPGSVSVKINGMEETRFEMDYASGTLRFLTTIRHDDRIEVTYSMTQGAENNGDILFAWGNVLPFSELFTVDLAAGVRWNILPGAYSEEAYSRTGVVLTSLSLHGQSDNFSYKVAGAVSFSNPDTTGILRLSGMEGKGIEIPITEDMAYPAAKPAFVIGTRGRLLYKDYRQYDILGSYSLQPLDWSVPSDQVFAYENGSQPGPYLVGEGSEGKKDESIVLDFELDNANDWVGFQIPVVAKQGLIDLSRIKSILYSYRVAERTGPGNVDVYVQLGDLGEDVDGDNVLDEELSKLSRGFQFNDTANGVNLYVGGGPKGQGNGIIDSEDVDGNGFLDAENPGYIFTSSANSLAGVTGWAVQNIPVSIADQERFKRVRTIRIVVVASGGSANGKILIDNLRLEGTSFWTDDTGDNVTLREVEETFLNNKPSEDLEHAFPEVERIFHNENQRNQVLEVGWNFMAASTFDIKSVFKSGTEGIRYQKVVVYAARTSLAGASTITLALNDNRGKGIRASFDYNDLSYNEWQKITIDIKKRKVYLNDDELAGATVSIDNYDSLLYFTAHFEGANTGSMLLDELHLEDPDGAIGAAVSVDTDLSFPGTLVSIGEFPLVSDLRMSENFITVTPGFANLYGEPTQDMSMDSLTEISCGLLFSELEADLAVQGVNDEWTFSGGHNLKIPKQSFPVTFIDRFSVRERSWGKEVSRGNDLLLAVPGIAALSLYQNTFSQEQVLAQDWSADFAFSALSPYILSLTTDIATSSSGFRYQNQWYFASWIYSYQYILPWKEGIVQDRRWDFSVQQSLNTVPLGFGLDMESGYNSYEITPDSRSQNNYLVLSLTLPIKIGAVTITPGYSRTLNTTRAFLHSGSFTKDLEALFWEYEMQEYIWTLLPLYELFDPETEDIFQDKNQDIQKASYKPEVTLGMVRSFGSSLWDLFLPSQIDLSLGKEFLKQDALYDDLTIFSLKTKTNAINLFGRYGAYSFMNFYTVDEFVTAISLTLAYDKSNSLDNYEFSVENLFQFENEVKNAFIIKNLFTMDKDELLQISDQGSIEFKWYIRPEEGTPLPLISKEMAATGYYAHAERISAQIYNIQKDMSTHPINVIITHETSIVFPDFGYIRGEISLGMDWENIPEQLRESNAIIVGFRLALEINLTF